MKRTTLLTTLCCGLLFALLLPLSAQNTIQQRKDSLRCVIDTAEGPEKLKSYQRLYYLYMSEIADDSKMDTLVSLLRQTEREAIHQGNVKTQGMVYGNTIITYINRNEYDKIIEKTPAYLDFFIRNEQWQFYYQIHMQLITAYNFKKEYEAAAREAEIMYHRAEQRKDKGGMATALYATGITYNLQERWKEQEESFRECIRLLWESKGYDNILTQAYAFLCISLRVQQRHEEVLQLMPQYEKAVARFEKASGRKQPEARGNLYLALMNSAVDTGAYDEAEKYRSKLEGLVDNGIAKYEMLRAEAHIRCSRGEYPQALAAIDSAMTYVRESAFDLNQARTIKMDILYRMGRSGEAYHLHNEILAANDSIKNVEVNTRFDELRTRYEVEKHIAEKQRNFHYFLFAVGLSGVLVLLLAGVFYYNRQMAAKNRKLYERIKEQDRLTDNLFRIAHTVEAAPDSCNPVTLNEHYLLVARLREYLHSDERLTCTEINRDEIITALGTNRKKLNDAVRAITGKSTMEYMRLLKIEEARKILELNPDMTLEEITYTCGFNNPSTFYRLFRKQCGITPAEYRKQALAKKK